MSKVIVRANEETTVSPHWFPTSRVLRRLVRELVEGREGIGVLGGRDAEVGRLGRRRNLRFPRGGPGLKAHTNVDCVKNGHTDGAIRTLVVGPAILPL